MSDLMADIFAVGIVAMMLTTFFILCLLYPTVMIALGVWAIFWFN